MCVVCGVGDHIHAGCPRVERKRGAVSHADGRCQRSVRRDGVRPGGVLCHRADAELGVPAEDFERGGGAAGAA